MASPPTEQPKATTATLPRVLVATTAMLSFISFWRAAAIILNDLASSAFYAGGIAEHAVGKAAPCDGLQQRRSRHIARDGCRGRSTRRRRATDVHAARRRAGGHMCDVTATLGV